MEGSIKTSSADLSVSSTSQDGAESNTTSKQGSLSGRAVSVGNKHENAAEKVSKAIELSIKVSGEVLEEEGLQIPLYDDVLIQAPMGKLMNEKYESLLPLLNEPDEHNRLRLQETVKYIEINYEKLITIAKYNDQETLYIHPPKNRKIEKKVSPFHIEISFDDNKDPQIFILPKDHFLGRGSFKSVRMAIDYLKHKKIACATIKVREKEEMVRTIKEYNIQKSFNLAVSFCFYCTERNAKVKIMVPYANQGNLEPLLSPTGHARFVQQFSPDIQQQILQKLLQFIHHLHEEGYVISDIKPHNILFNYNQENGAIDIFITDFGTSYHIDDDEAERFAGSPCYMGPEYLLSTKIEDNTKINHKTDVFALGRTLWEIFVGGPPPWVIGLPRVWLWYKPAEYIKSWKKYFRAYQSNVPEDSLEILILKMMNPVTNCRPTIKEIIELKPTLKLGSPTYRGMRLLTTRESLYRMQETEIRWKEKFSERLDPEKCYTLTVDPKSKAKGSFYIETINIGKTKKFKRYKVIPSKKGGLKIYTGKLKSKTYQSIDEFINKRGLEYCLNFFI